MRDEEEDVKERNREKEGRLKKGKRRDKMINKRRRIRAEC